MLFAVMCLLGEKFLMSRRPSDAVRSGAYFNATALLMLEKFEVVCYVVGSCVYVGDLSCNKLGCPDNTELCPAMAIVLSM